MPNRRTSKRSAIPMTPPPTSERTYPVRCCTAGCAAVRPVSLDQLSKDGWYHADGFMIWACPAHAEMWRRYDSLRSLRKEQATRLELWITSKFKVFAVWFVRLLLPRPKRPAFQSSIPGDSERITIAGQEYEVIGG